MMQVMSTSAAVNPDHGATLLQIYDDALPAVYGYLRRRVDSDATAQDLTSETFLAACTSIRQGLVREVATAWLIGIARHKLLDHYRRTAREERKLRVVESAVTTAEDPWTTTLRDDLVQATLADLGLHHRAALLLRHLDGLSVPEVATTLGRTVHATEALLSRARVAFRTTYEIQAERERTQDAN